MENSCFMDCALKCENILFRVEANLGGGGTTYTALINAIYANSDNSRERKDGYIHLHSFTKSTGISNLFSGNKKRGSNASVHVGARFFTRPGENEESFFSRRRIRPSRKTQGLVIDGLFPSFRLWKSSSRGVTFQRL